MHDAMLDQGDMHGMHYNPWHAVYFFTESMKKVKAFGITFTCSSFHDEASIMVAISGIVYAASMDECGSSADRSGSGMVGRNQWWNA